MVTIPLNEGVTSAFWPLLRLDLVEVAPVGLNAGDRRTRLLPASLGRSRYLSMTAIQPPFIARRSSSSVRSCLPQALVKRPKAFPVQAFLRFSGKLTVTNDIDHALNIFIVHLMCRHCRLPFDRVLSKQYRASGRVPLGVFLQTRQ